MAENQEFAAPTHAVAGAPRRPPAGKRPRRDPVELKSINLAGEDRQRLIAEAAYFRAERRGFAPGRELEDWLDAEIEVDALLDADDRA